MSFDLKPLGALAALALASAGCAGSPACAGDSCEGDGGPPACTATFTGNYADQVSLASPCAELVPGENHQQGDFILTLGLSSPGGQATTDVKIDLGPSPATGNYANTSVASWQALAVRANNCELSAGSQAVPTGGFELTLNQVSGLPDAPVVHGTLDIDQHLSSPLGTDCGPGDTEHVAVTF